ncbi:MAG: purine-binding chemotaxis protein CheW [Tenuifilum sp.]|jgi:purine-binding chemotaxis protein CheW|uniref:chemotaxis protein CheW n=1 Tax=Tenuifilum sp. TaxID=2760880 RepID=UPI0024AADAC9|nr:chemotaxis protein CheW [Tenuifilum sp.]MDI3528074.1 purine-binding chemotaxis protein CheW [Tenuifilum sp.]
MDKDNKNQIKSYLTFKLGTEEFAAHVSKVLNILEMTPITKVPKAPEYLKGVINLRGAVLPVIDARIKFGMPEAEYTNNTCIIVLDIDVDGESVHVGAIVDSVQAVVEIDNSQIMPLPTLGSRYKSEFIIGMAKIDDRFVIILNMDAVFSTDDITQIVDADSLEDTETENNE